MSILDESHEIFEQKGSRLLVQYEKDDDKNHLPPWFNLEKLRRVKPLVNQYFFSIFVIHLSGLLILVFIRSIHQTLSKTGKSKDLLALFHRYLQTCLHVKGWYEGKIWNRNDAAYESIRMVSTEMIEQLDLF